MDAVKTDVEALVQKELQAANEKFPLFHSTHEGYAVLLEEVDELKADLAEISQDVDVLWKLVKQNDATGEQARVFIRSIKIRAILAAIEAIQVAAMCEKYKISFGMKETNPESIGGNING